MMGNFNTDKQNNGIMVVIWIDEEIGNLLRDDVSASRGRKDGSI